MHFLSKLGRRVVVIRAITIFSVTVFICLIQGYYYTFKNIPLSEIIILTVIIIAGAVGLIEYSIQLTRKLLTSLENEVKTHESTALALKQSEQLYKTLIQTSPDGVVVTDMKGFVTYMSPGAKELLGYAPNDNFDEKSSYDIILPKYHSILKNNLARLLKGKSNQNTAYEAYKKNGTVTFIEISSAVIYDSENKPGSFMATLRDISDRVEAAAEIERQKIQAEKYLDIANVIILAQDVDGNVTLINKRGAKLLGYDKDEIIGKNWVNTFIPHEKRAQIEAVFSLFISGTTPLPEAYENAILTKNNEEIYIAWHNTLLYDEVGNITGILSSGEDITENRQIQEALEESEEKYRLLVENANEAIVVIQNGYIKYVNTRACIMVEYSEDDMFQLPFSHFIHEEDRPIVMDRHIRRIKGDFVPEVYNFRLITKTGEIKWVELNGIKISWQNEPATLNFISDVTSRKEAEDIQRVLYEISKSVNATEDLFDLSEFIKTEIGRIIDTTNFYIALYDKATDTLSLPFFADEKDEFEKFPAKKTLTGHVIKTGEPLLARNDVLDQLEQSGNIELVGTPAKVWLGVPLVVGSDVIGAVVVQSYENVNLYTEKDLEILSFVSGQMALALARKENEKKIKESLHEKVLMLQEIHHRVKNNLQIIHSLLYLQSKKIKDSYANEMFVNTQNRIRSMALIHEKLYGSQDLARVDFADYTTSLADHLRNIYNTSEKLVNINVKINKIFLPIDTAIPCGLIINELLSNSLKYAFPEKQTGNINVEMYNLNGASKNVTNQLRLKVSDNGIGFPEDLTDRPKRSLGMILVQNLTSQLDGEINQKNEKGAITEIDFNII